MKETSYNFREKQLLKTPTLTCAVVSRISARGCMLIVDSLTYTDYVMNRSK